MNSHDVTAHKESETRYRHVSELVSDYAFALHLDAQETIFVGWLTDNCVEVSRVPVDQVIGTPNALAHFAGPARRLARQGSLVLMVMGYGSCKRRE